MKFHVFGDVNKEKIILIHGVQTPWQIWMTQIEYFCEKYCVIVPALDGHEEDRKSEFISVEQEAEQIENYCIKNHGKDIFAVCGLSMGGAIAYTLWKNGILHIQKLIMDGAPLVPYSSFLKNMMTNQYLKLTRKSQKRDSKTLEMFKKSYLPERYLESFLKIADNMSDETIKNMISSIGKNTMSEGVRESGEEIMYIYGTAMNEMLSKKSVKLLKKYYSKITIVCFKGDKHCYKAIYEPKKWIETVESFLTEKCNELTKK